MVHGRHIRFIAPGIPWRTADDYGIGGCGSGGKFWRSGGQCLNLEVPFFGEMLSKPLLDGTQRVRGRLLGGFHGIDQKDAFHAEHRSIVDVIHAIVSG